MDQLVSVIQRLVEESLSWAEVTKKFIVVAASAEDDEEAAEGAQKAAAAPKAPTVVAHSARGSFSRPSVLINGAPN